MNLIDWLYFKKNGLFTKLRALRRYHFFKSSNIIIGKNLIVHRGKGKHTFGNNIKILDNCIFESHNKQSEINVGDDCFFSYGVVLVCTRKIVLGNNVWIGEYTSIRDSTHDFSIHHKIGSLYDKNEEVIIGNNVWIGRGCLISLGSVIEDNVIIAANSVVKGFCKSNAVYGGCPAKFIKEIVK